MRIHTRVTVLIAAIALLLIGFGPLREPIAVAAQKAQEVFVTNDAANAVPVREQARLTVVQISRFATFLTGDTHSSQETLYTVPAGKILVIDSVSVSCILSPGDHLLDVTFGVTSGDVIPYSLYAQGVDEGFFAPTNVRVFRGTDQITAYAGPGTAVTAFGTRDGTSLSGTALGVAISGHLIDAP
jgi:hypothetical protein